MKMMDFVAEQLNSNQTTECFKECVSRYREFLLKPIQANMFIECDEENNILLESEWKQFEGTIDDLQSILLKHKEAISRIYFPGFKFVEIKGNEVTIRNKETGSVSYIPLEPNTYQTIEEPLVRSGYEISEYAQRMFMPDYKITQQPN